MATNGTDFLFFVGSLEQVTVTLVNPYSSKEFFVDDEFNVNQSSYDGMGGTDYMIMSNYGDYLSIVSDHGATMGMQVVHNVEIFQAGNGGDVINLAHANITYGSVSIFGGEGDDILWANTGDDYIYGASGNDIIDGGPGNDFLYGEADNDQIFGGVGDDYINGGAGNDFLYGGTDLGLRNLDKDFQDSVSFPMLQENTSIVNLMPPGTSALGISNDNLTVAYGASATITFREGYAGYNNSFGIFSLAEDGTIQNADMLWKNVKTAGFDVDHQIDIPVGAEGGQFGFFIIADGNTVNGKYTGLDITEDGHFKFVYDFGGANERAANINDDGNMVSAIYDDGLVQVELKGNNYFTTMRGDDAPNINADHKIHAVSGLADENNPEVLRIGFEDLKNWGDADFEDVLFDLDINEVHIDASETGSDTLIGGAGDDYLYGEGGDDILIVGEGYDVIIGGSGSDRIVYDYLDAITDKIVGFETGAGGDVLDISQILSDFDSGSDDVADFVRILNNASGDSQVLVNADGDNGGQFVAIAMIEGGVDMTMADLINNGNLVLV